MIDLGLIGPMVAVTIAIALLFDFYNGKNDSANSIATVVATRALPPWAAVLMAATFNFLGAFVGTAVAEAVGKGILNVDIVDTHVILAALLGGLAWTWVATESGTPISVSHSLIGGLVGAGLAAAGRAGLAPIEWGPLWPLWAIMAQGALIGLVLALLATALSNRKWMAAGLGGVVFGSGIALVTAIALGTAPSIPKLVATVMFILYSPVLGFALAWIFGVTILWFVHRSTPSKVNGVFKVLQIGSASFYSLGHGTNDAQKTMGVITILLLANGVIDTFVVPWEIIIAAGLAIALGTFIGGYKVVRTMGQKLTNLEPYQGFSAETSSALGLFWLAHLGVPVSTTHSITGSIMGVGAIQRVTAVSWGVARRIIAAWVITIPASALVAGLTWYVLGFVI